MVVADMISFIWRVLLIIFAWVFIWDRIQPKTLSMRVLRAFLIALSMIAILAITKIVGV